MIESTPLTDVYNVDVYNSIPTWVKKIVEIGVGSGALAKKINETRKEIEYIGVEIHEEYCKKSSAYCSRVYNENFENPSPELVGELSNTDVVIFADVIEHFNNPWRILARLNKWMASHSMIVACIPNIQHWSIQLSLLRGDFIYSETGLLDKTHLRFFTKNTIKDLFEKTGYVLTEISPRVFDFAGQADSLNFLSRMLGELNLDRDRLIAEAAAYQYVVVARKDD